MAVYLGMERDVLSCSDPQSLDYFIASVHYFTAPDGRRIGVARGYMTEPYPAAFLLSAWKEWGGEAIINSDCHYAPLIDGGYSQAEELLLSLGYDHIVRLIADPEKGMWEQASLK